MRVPKKERIRAIKTARLFIPDGSKLCEAHFEVDSWAAVSNQAVILEYDNRQIEDMLNLALSEDEIEAASPSSSIDIKIKTGLTKEQFEDLFLRVPSLSVAMRNVPEAKKALFMLLMRFRQGASYDSIAKQCGLTPAKASKDIGVARNALTNDFVPNYLGFGNLSRDFLLRNTTDSARILHAQNDPNRLITVWDGTYIYIDKSANHEFQKLSFSGQKDRNFLRPMMCVTTNGYIIDVFGPFPASKNDATCMTVILQNYQEVSDAVQPDDIFIFDRGFRDCVAEVENMGYVVKSPGRITGNRHQLTTEQANQSRLVTKTRFVVETRNGHMKTIFPIFAKRWSTLLIAQLSTEMRIAAALINKYFQRIVADKG